MVVSIHFFDPFHINQFSLVQFLDRLGRLGDMRDDSAEILFQSFLQEAPVSSSGIYSVQENGKAKARAMDQRAAWSFI